VLGDGDRIRNLLGRYSELIDAGDFTGVGSLFADGCLADENGTELARGAEAVAAFFAALVRLHHGSPGTKHLVLNTVLDEAGPDTVTAHSSYVVLQAAPDGSLQPIIAGRYEDRFERVTGGWRFAERRFTVDLSGDLSRHLRLPVDP
jgi:ketosteroid isomerase-like protein